MKSVEEITRQLEEIGTQWGIVKELPGHVSKITLAVDEFRKEFDAHRKLTLTRMDDTHRESPRHVSRGCAAHLAALTLAAGHRVGRLNHLEAPKRDRIVGWCNDVLQIRAPASPATPLTASEVMLPSLYGSEVAELVSQYGTARQYGTVYPLGAGTTYLPKLSTDTAFGLISMSAAVTEKKPAVENVTFSAKKWGGLVAVPSELDEDALYDLGQFIARYAARQMAKLEDTVFWAADGTATYDSLQGLTKNVVTDAKLVTLDGGETTISDSDVDDWRSLVTKVDAAVIRTGAYFVHPSFVALFNKFNKSGDKPFLANGLNNAFLDGFPIRWIDTLPAYTTDASISTVYGLFGDPSWMYLGMRGGMRFDTDQSVYFATDELAVRALERFTIGKMATGCMAGIRTAAA